MINDGKDEFDRHLNRHIDQTTERLRESRNASAALTQRIEKQTTPKETHGGGSALSSKNAERKVLKIQGKLKTGIKSGSLGANP